MLVVKYRWHAFHRSMPVTYLIDKHYTYLHNSSFQVPIIEWFVTDSQSWRSINCWWWTFYTFSVKAYTCQQYLNCKHFTDGFALNKLIVLHVRLCWYVFLTMLQTRYVCAYYYTCRFAYRVCMYIKITATL